MSLEIYYIHKYVSVIVTILHIASVCWSISLKNMNTYVINS